MHNEGRGILMQPRASWLQLIIRVPGIMAEAAEARLTEQLRNEMMTVDKECIRPLQVSLYIRV